MILLLFFFSTLETIKFNVDPVVYRTTLMLSDTVTKTTRQEDIFYVEFNGAIPYQELEYVTIDSAIVAKATIVFKLSDINHQDSLVDTLYRRFTIPSFSTAAKEQMTFIFQFGLHVPTGKFIYDVSILSGKKVGSLESEIEVAREKYRISDLLIASNITSDTASNYLRKGNLRVIPHPSHQFGDRYNILYCYYEIYDIKPAADSITIVYQIENAAKKIVRKFSRAVAKKSISQAINFGLNVQGLDPGFYVFRVQVSDASSPTITRNMPFEIRKTVTKEISYEEDPYYDKIEYFATPEEYKYFESLPKEGRATFLKKFWSTRNYFEIAELFEYANSNYKQGNKPGYKTERGRVYIKYGPPDEIERSTIEYYESRPYEHWHYFNGKEFLFLDLRGTNEFTLVWTNVPGEQCQPTLYKYLSREKLELIE